MTRHVGAAEEAREAAAVLVAAFARNDLDRYLA